jgi:hypothetical protein
MRFKLAVFMNFLFYSSIVACWKTENIFIINPMANIIDYGKNNVQ